MTTAPAPAAILVLPGMDGTGALFRPFVRLLERRRRAIVVAYPTDRPLDYPALTDFAAGLAPREPHVVLAESFSGPIAIALAARDPDVIGLILVSSFARHPLPRWFGPPSRLIDVRRLPRWLIEAALLGSDRTPSVRDALAAAVASVAPEAMRARTTAALAVDARRQLREVNCPVMAVAASRDLLLGARGLAGILEAKPRCQVETVRGPHMLLETRPAEVATLVDRFCSQVDHARPIGRAT